jgi:hypothetical protein
MCRLCFIFSSDFLKIVCTSLIRVFLHLPSMHVPSIFTSLYLCKMLTYGIPNSASTTIIAITVSGVYFIMLILFLCFMVYLISLKKILDGTMNVHLGWLVLFLNISAKSIGQHNFCTYLCFATPSKVSMA